MDGSGVSLMLTIPRPLYDAMIQHLQDEYPLEACGLLAGQDGVVSRQYPIENILRSPVAYEMEPTQQIQAIIELEEAGLELSAIYHSHPQGPPAPSETDVALAYWPDAAYIIVSLQDRAAPQTRAFAILEGRVTEIPLALL
ncbi:MAG TPA: M67 family peptidase [Chloroflexi bacterium]|nr:M67 family peptidase [Chloroflexota bacterium]